MGTSRSVDQFSSKLIGLADATEKAKRDAVFRGSLLTKEIIIAEAAAAGINPTSKIAGGRWGVGFDVKGTQNPTSLVKVRGPFHLADSPTKAHDIQPKRRRGRKALKLPENGDDSGVRIGPVRHPGTQGKRSFPKAKAKAHVAVPRVMGVRLVSAWRQALK